MSGAEGDLGVVETLFRLDSIAAATAPAGSEGVWHRYVIAQGTNRITGLRSGTRAEVDYLLQRMVEQLNERSGKQRNKVAKTKR